MKKRLSASAEFSRLYDARDNARNQMWVNGAICFAGTALSWGSFTRAIGGGRYILFWGAIIFGGYRFIRGLYYYVKINRSIKTLTKYYDDLSKYSNLMANMLGYPSYDELEKHESERLGFPINTNDNIETRLSSFSHQYGVSEFKDLYGQVYDNYMKKQVTAASSEGAVQA